MIYFDEWDTFPTQLNGPIITAFKTAMTNWFRDHFKVPIEYLSGLSIADATDELVVVLGCLMGIPRVQTVSQENFDILFKFTTDKQQDVSTGLGLSSNPNLGGGFFASGNEVITTDDMPLSLYRELLKVLSQYETTKSYITIDNITYALLNGYVDSWTYSYGGENKSNDDITINYRGVTSIYVSMLVSIVNILYNTLPRVYVE